MASDPTPTPPPPPGWRSIPRTVAAVTAVPAGPSAVPKVPRLSPTAIGQWTSCPRSWYYGWLVGPRPPPSAAMALGTAVHAEIERWLTSGLPAGEAVGGRGYSWGDGGSLALDRTYRDVVAIARAGEVYLRPLRPRVATGAARVEVKAHRPPGDVGPLVFDGRIDVVDDGLRLVVDHKTTGSLDAPWLPDAAALARDTQMLLYAWAVLPPGDPIGVAHIRYRTRGSPLAAMVVATGVPWSNVEERHGEAEGISRAMGALHDGVVGDDRAARIARAHEVEYNPGGCRKYGGCPWAQICPDSPDNRGRRTTAAALTTRTRAPAAGAGHHHTAAPTAPGAAMSAADIMDLFGGTPASVTPSNGSGHAAPTPAALPANVGDLFDDIVSMASAATATLAPGAVGAVVPPDGRPDDDGRVARAVAAVRALGGWPGPRAVAAIAAQHGLSPEACTHALVGAGMGPPDHTGAVAPAAAGPGSFVPPAATKPPSKAAAEREADASALVVAIAACGGTEKVAIDEASKALWAQFCKLRPRPDGTPITSVRSSRRTEARTTATSLGWLDANGPAGGLLLTAAGVAATRPPAATPPVLADPPYAPIPDALDTGAVEAARDEMSDLVAARAKQLRDALGRSSAGYLPFASVRVLCGELLDDVLAAAQSAGWATVTSDGVEAVDAAPTPAVAAPAPAPTPTPAPAPTPAPPARKQIVGANAATDAATQARLGLHFICLVLVDCLPVGVEARPLRSMPRVAAAIAVVEARAGVNVDLVEYGKGPPSVVAELRNTPGVDAGAWLADGRDPVAAAVWPVLQAAGALVVRGVR